MPGFERTRFVDLLDTIADGLTCVVCLNIFDNPVITDCGHTYCYDCIESNVKSGHHECPKCRTKMENKKFTDFSYNSNSIVVTDGSLSYVFVRNLTVASMVGQLRVKCQNESNGCPLVMDLDFLPIHLKQCEHQLCQTCGFKLDILWRTTPVEDHNCVALLKKSLIEYNHKLAELSDKYQKLSEQNQMNIKVWRIQSQKYEHTIQELQDMMSIHESNAEKSAICYRKKTNDFIASVNFVMFGTIESKCLHCRVDRTGIELKGVSLSPSSDFPDDSLLPQDVFIPYHQMQELKYCLELSMAVIIIKASEECSFELESLLRLDRRHTFNFGFCIYSYDSGKRYIIIMLDTKDEKLGPSLFQWSTVGNNRLKPVAINWKQTQDMLDRALGVKGVASDDSDITSVVDSD